MKSTFLKVTLTVVIATAAFACKNSAKETSTAIAPAAEATEVAAKYEVDTAESKISWEGAKPTGKHHGSISLASGTIFLNDGAMEAGNFVIDMNTINVEDLEGEDKANLEAHLKGTVEGKEGDFFHVKDYPTATFEMTKFENNTVHGNLTLRDKTHAVQFPATVTQDGNTLIVKSETFEIDRTQWGVNYGSKSIFPSLGDKFINDAIILTVSIVAKKA